jgi:hypothetical protein
MPGLVPGIHVFFFESKQDVDGRDKPGHDELSSTLREEISNYWDQRLFLRNFEGLKRLALRNRHLSEL